MIEPLRVRETVRHGNYHNVRTVEMPVTWDGFTALLLSSPYCGSQTAESLAANTFVAATFASLLRDGRASHGWATYDVVPA